MQSRSRAVAGSLSAHFVTFSWMFVTHPSRYALHTVTVPGSKNAVLPVLRRMSRNRHCAGFWKDVNVCQLASRHETVEVRPHPPRPAHPPGLKATRPASAKPCPPGAPRYSASRRLGARRPLTVYPERIIMRTLPQSGTPNPGNPKSSRFHPTSPSSGVSSATAWTQAVRSVLVLIFLPDPRKLDG